MAINCSCCKYFFYFRIFNMNMKKTFTRIFPLIVAFFLLTVTTKAQFFLNNAAISQPNRCFLLTDTVANQRAQVWRQQQINLTQKFEIYATLEFGSRDSAGGEGIAFIFHQAGLLANGFGAGSMGYRSITPSLCVEMDTDQNIAEGDPNFDHISLMRNGVTNHTNPFNLVGPLDMKISGQTVKDSLPHMFHLIWDPSINNLKVWIDCDLRIDYNGNIIQNFFSGFPLVYWGFTAATNTNFNRQRVCINYLSTDPQLPDTTMCAGVPLNLNAQFGHSFQWSPSAGLSNDTIGTPVATPLQTTTYNVSIYDSCGIFRTDSYIHTVIDSNIVEFFGDTVTCAGIPIPFKFNTQGTAPFNITINDGTNNTNYLLNANGNLNATNQPIVLTPTGTTTYTITNLTAPGACGSRASGSLTVTHGILNNMLLNLNNTTCFGVCNGAASIFLPHESTTYTYLWPNQTGGNSKSGLCAGNYDVIVSNNQGCIDTIQFTINQPNAITIPAIGPLTACKNQAVSITPNPAGGTQPYTYNWSNGAITPSITVSDTFTTRTYRVSISDANNCQPGVLSVIVNRTPNLRVVASQDTGMCIGNAINISANASGGDGNYTYTWSTGTNGNTALVDPSVDSTFFVSVSDGCGSPIQTDSVRVLVEPYPIHTYTINDPACLKDRILFEVDEYSSVNQYAFDFGDGKNGFLNNSSSIYHSYRDTGCFDITLRIRGIYCDSIRTDTCRVFIQFSPDANLEQTPKELRSITSFIGNFEDKTPTGVSSEWYLDGMLVGSERNLEYNFPTHGEYELMLVTTNAEGCTDTLLYPVIVNEDYRGFFIPNAFSPNGDGLNDTFGPVIMERDITEYEFVIFTRMGEEIFRTDNPDIHWDGRKFKDNSSSGRVAKQDIFVYQITYLDRNAVYREYKGTVLIIK